MHINEIRKRLIGKRIRITFGYDDDTTTKDIIVEKIEKSKKFNGFITINDTEEETRNNIEEVAEYGTCVYGNRHAYRKLELFDTVYIIFYDDEAQQI